MAFLSANPIVLPYKKLRIRTGCLEGLSFLWLEITRHCNLTCTHCYASSRPGVPMTERMTLADWYRVLDEARATGCRRVQFIGGEPTAHPDLPTLLEHARALGFRDCEVFTNATLLRDDLVRTFARFRVRVRFSFYSFDASVHDAITGRKGSFEQTIEGLHELIRRKVRLAAGVILLPQNAPHVKRTKQFLRALGIRSIAIDRVRGVGRGERLVPNARLETELCGACWSGKLCIDANGDAHPCVFSRAVSVGNVLDDGFRDVVGGPRLHAFRRQMFLGEQGGNRGTMRTGGVLQ